MKRLSVVFGAALLLASVAIPVAADEWNLRGYGAWMDTSVDFTVLNDDNQTINVDGSSEIGLGGSLEYQFNDRWGVEAGVISASPEINLRVALPVPGAVVLKDTLSTTALILELDLHLTPASSALDIYIGAGLADVSYGSLTFQAPVGDDLGVRVADDTSWTAKAALDYAFGKSGWGLTVGLRFIDSEAEFSETDDPPSDSLTEPNELLVGTIGLVYSFR